MQSQPLRAWKLGLTTSYGVTSASPNQDMDAYMATLSIGEAWDLCWELGHKKNYTQLSTQVLRQNNQDPTFMMINHFKWLLEAHNIIQIHNNVIWD